MISIQSGPDLTVGLLNTFRDAYMTGVRQHPALPSCMEIGLPTDGRYEAYAYPETAPYPEQWRQGDPIPTGTFKYVGWTTPNYRFGKRIAWDADDRADGKTKSLYDQASSLGAHFATLVERFFVDVITATASVLPAIPTAPNDAQALFYGSTRFGVSTGNIVPGSGVASATAIRSNFMTAMGRFALFQDTQGQPYFQNGELNDGFVVMYAPENEEQMRSAFSQGITPHIIVGASGANVTGGATAVAVAGVENIIKTTGIPIELWPSPRITGSNDWYIFARGVKHKAVYEQRRMSVTGTYATDQNSDHVRNVDQEYVQFKSRHGVGIAPPFGAIKVDN
jgi:hypothetical protein